VTAGTGSRVLHHCDLNDLSRTVVERRSNRSRITAVTTAQYWLRHRDRLITSASLISRQGNDTDAGHQQHQLLPSGVTSYRPARWIVIIVAWGSGRADCVTWPRCGWYDFQTNEMTSCAYVCVCLTVCVHVCLAYEACSRAMTEHDNSVPYTVCRHIFAPTRSRNHKWQAASLISRTSP